MLLSLLIAAPAKGSCVMASVTVPVMVWPNAVAVNKLTKKYRKYFFMWIYSQEASGKSLEYRLNNEFRLIAIVLKAMPLR